MAASAQTFKVVSEDYSVAGTTDLLEVPGVRDFHTAARLAARMSGLTCRAWVVDAKGRKLFEAGPTADGLSATG